ncbi:TFIID-18kDa-domain-containing protein [Anaeromyces robustus]|uniref:Transcription initiation factor TFIID subunit 13 n=1 Tax=Anaeromyces robustus TaxID=1754192 RepID=A0A1Y1XLY2_9FUNG|nr:TFIID-18kDa-domain-containing protein [Anaeromyces robustus]|eukprot:ORX86526.1 TFIID-18kDa-domain-containing protein [Anaeromyces robustus]
MKEKRKHQFTKEIKLLMYGFGDVQNPRQDSAELLEDILYNYLQDICTKVARVGHKRGKVITDDFLYILRKDPKKLARCKELLIMQEDLRKARTLFEEPEMNIKGKKRLTNRPEDEKQ